MKWIVPYHISINGHLVVDAPDKESARQKAATDGHGESGVRPCLFAQRAREDVNEHTFNVEVLPADAVELAYHDDLVDLS